MIPRSDFWRQWGKMMSGSILVLAFLQAAAADPMADGMKALEANNFEAAATDFSKAVAKDPADYAAHFHLALSYSMLKKDDEAVAEYRKTLELKPGLYEAQLNIGIVLVRNKAFADAVTELSAASAQKPKEFRPQYYLGEALRASGDFAKAAETFETAAALDPKSAAAELGWGQSLAAQNKLADAAPHFRKAAELDPKYRDALLELAANYEKAGQPADAIEIYKQFPENPGAQERMGELQLETKRYADAIPGLEKAVAASPTSANRLALATAYGLNKQFDKELEQLQKVVAAEPENFQLRMRYGRALRDQKQLVPAENQFAAAAKLDPQSVEAWNELAGIAIPLQDYPTGLAALDRVKALGKETPGNLFIRAITLDKLKQLKPALAAYEEFLATSGGKFPDQEFQARQRVKVLKRELGQR
jgi:tetratricopeptide (TPR) repeat protein